MNTILLRVIGGAITLIILIAIVRGCEGEAKTYPTHDRWGNRYPNECRQDLSQVPVLVKDVSLGYAADGRKTVGFFSPPKNKNSLPLIELEESITNQTIRAEILHHELCHAYMWYLYGDYNWHPK